MGQPIQLNKTTVSGEGGGGGSDRPYVPVEAANTLQANTFLRIVDLLCEGEIGGPANDGSWYKSTYLDEIPIQNSDDSYNLTGVGIVGRTGTSAQEYLSGFNGIENTVSVITDVTVSGSAITRTITDSDVDDVKVTISIPAMMSQADNGDLNRTALQLRISITPNNGAGTKQTVIDPSKSGRIYGKCNSEYQRQYVIENLLRFGSAPWVVTVERVTADSTSVKLVNAFKWYSYTTVIQTKLRYYDRAVIGMAINGRLFGNKVPSRAYKVNGRKIAIPDNYDPDTRTYSGDWSGSFTTGVSNNPAWIVYDLLTDSNAGIGDLITADMIDKWTLYACGVYCDTQVSLATKTKESDGSYTTSNDTESRFSFNGVIQTRKQALNVIIHLCGVFRAYPVWSAGKLTFIQDKPITSPARPVGLSNISEEGFQYEGVPKRDRHSVVKVSWNDPEKLGKLDTIELVDEQGIRDFGYNEIDFAAMGCTSRTEAIRRGKYVLDSDINAREIVKFSGGLEWADALPGELISVQDPNYASTILEGRVKSGTTTSLVLDKEIEIENGITYTMLIQTAEGAAEERELTNSAETTDALTWTTPLDNVPFQGAVLVISTSNLATRKFVLVNIQESNGKYNINGIEYDTDKYARIEDGVVAEIPITTVLMPDILTPPTSIAIEAYTYTEGNQNLRKFGIQISWTHSTDPRVDYYELRHRPSSGGLVFLGKSLENSYDWRDVVGDTYDIQVRGVGVGIVSEWLSYTDFTLNAVLINLAPPTSLDTLSGSGLWSGRDCTITWAGSTGSEFASNYDDDVGDSNVAFYKIEVRKSDTTLIRTFNTASKDITEFTYFYNNNVDDNTTPLRSLLFYVYAVDVFETSSSIYASISASNPAPDMSGSTPVITDKYSYLKINWTLSTDNDISHYKIYLDSSNPPTTEIGTISHPGDRINAQGLDYDIDYYVQIEPYDLFGPGAKSVIPSAGHILKIPSINIDSELQGSILMSDSDSNNEATLTKLYDGSISSDGVPYTLSGTDKYIQYQFGIEDYFDRVGIWTADANGHVYIAYSDNGSIWSYLKAEVDHTLDTDNKLVIATDQTDAKTNYWQLSTGINVALFPNNLIAKYIRLYLTGTYSTTIYEFIPSRILISELAAIGHLSAISADIGLVEAGIIKSADGNTVFNLDDGTMAFDDKLTWDGINLAIVGTLTITSATGYGNISDIPTELSDINSTEGTKLTGIATGADVTPALPSDESLVGYWSMDEGSGTTVKDNSNENNDGTISGTAAWVPGISGTALDFAASGGAVSCGSDSSLSSIGDRTLTCWYRLDGSIPKGSGNWTIVTHASSVSGFVWIVQGANGLQYFVNYNSGGALTSQSSTTVITPGEWAFLAIVIKSGVLTFYLNGEPDGGGAIDTEAASTVDFLIGSNSSSNSPDGSIDETRFYDKAISAQEMKALYLNPGGLKAPLPGADVTIDNETFSTESDIDVLQTTNAPVSAGADVTGDNTALNIINQGNLAVRDTVNATYIDGGSITTDKLDALAVTAAKIAALTITAAQIAANTLTANEIAANTITGDEITGTTISAIRAALGTITSGRIQNAANDTFLDLTNNLMELGSKLVWDGSTLSINGSVVITGGSGIANLTDAGDLATLNSVGVSKLDSTVISGGKITTDLVNANSIVAGTITTDRLIGGAITQTVLTNTTTDISVSSTWVQIQSRAITIASGGYVSITAGSLFKYATSTAKGELQLRRGTTTVVAQSSWEMNFTDDTGASLSYSENLASGSVTYYLYAKSNFACDAAYRWIRMCEFKK